MSKTKKMEDYIKGFQAGKQEAIRAELDFLACMLFAKEDMDAPSCYYNFKKVKERIAKLKEMLVEEAK